MRFEKTKLYVGIAIVLFILVCANLIAWGMIENKILAEIENKSCISATVQIIENKTIPPQKNTTVSPSQTTPPQNNPPANPPIVNSGTTTRAS